MLMFLRTSKKESHMSSPAPSIRLEQNLIVQGDLTMVVGGVLVMELCPNGEDAKTVANFLRCGCSAVQLTCDWREDVFEEQIKLLEHNLDALTIDGKEAFVVQSSYSGQGENPPRDYFVVTVTRLVYL